MTGKIFIGLVWVAFLALHFFFKKAELYWNFLWLDIPMHLVGGFLIMLTWAVWFGGWRRKAFYGFGGWVVLLGGMVSWEIYEWLIGETTYPRATVDTIADLLNGLVGGLVAYHLYLKHKK